MWKKNAEFKIHCKEESKNLYLYLKKNYYRFDEENSEWGL